MSGPFYSLTRAHAHESENSPRRRTEVEWDGCLKEEAQLCALRLLHAPDLCVRITQGAAARRHHDAAAITPWRLMCIRESASIVLIVLSEKESHP